MAAIQNPTISDYINQLNSDLSTLKDIMEEKGVTVTSSDNFTTLCPKVADIGGDPVSPKTISFSGLTSTSIALDNLNTVNINSMAEMFKNCTNLTTLDVSSFNLTNVTNMSQMFSGCTALTSLTLGNFNSSNVTNMQSMFYNIGESLTSWNITSFNTSSVTNMESMFSGNTNQNFVNDIIKKMNTSNVTNMNSMFYGCNTFTNLNLSYCVGAPASVNGMFKGCTSLQTLDLRNLEFSQITGATQWNEILGGGSSLVPYDCLIIVKNSTEKSWFTSKYPYHNNIKTVAEL